MDGIATIVLAIIGLFLLYRFKIVALGQTVTMGAVGVTADAVDYWTEKSTIDHDKRMGKLFTKLEEADYAIATKKDLSRLRKAKLAQLSVNKEKSKS
jgi:hypothetical protein